MYGEDEDKITLDRETFKTLSSGTRIGILKSLNIRRKTLSELSRQFGMSVSTIKEHLDNLANADLVEQKDDGHKWKYYELTRKGTGVLNPEDKKVWILLSLSVAAVFLTVTDAFTGFFGKVMSSQRAMEISSTVADTFTKTPLATGGEAATGAVTSAAASLPWIHISLIAAFSLLAGFSVFRALRNRRMTQL